MFLLVVKDRNNKTIRQYEGFKGFMDFRDNDMMPFLSKYGKITLEAQKTKGIKDDPEIDF